MGQIPRSTESISGFSIIIAVGPVAVVVAIIVDNKKLRYREEHSASVVLSWCRPTL